MAKKATKEAQENSSQRVKRQPSPLGRSRGTSGASQGSAGDVGDAASSTPAIRNLTELISRQLSATPMAEDEAVGAVIDSIVGHLGDSSDEGSELKLFLETLVETDPGLKSELISLLKK